MKVRLFVSRAGAGIAQSPGDIVEVGDDEGARMIAAGQGEEVEFLEQGPAKETATRKAKPQKAVKE